MTSSITIATWNILGRRVAGTRSPAWDGAVTQVVTAHRIDLLCLQEVQFYQGEPDAQLVRELSAAGLRHTTWLPLSPSHLDDDAALGVGIASNQPISGSDQFRLSNPGLTARVRGEQWILHDKGMVGAVVQVAGRPVHIYSLHLFPFHEFGVDDSDDLVDKMWSEFWEYADGLTDAALVLAGDYNQEQRSDAARQWSRKDWRFCLGDTITTSFGLSLDEIALSWTPAATRSWSVPTFSDHHLVGAEITPWAGPVDQWEARQLSYSARLAGPIG